MPITPSAHRSTHHHRSYHVSMDYTYHGSNVLLQITVGDFKYLPEAVRMTVDAFIHSFLHLFSTVFQRSVRVDIELVIR